MVRALSEVAKERGIKNFMVSYTDLFGGMRAKLVPAPAIDKMTKDGAGFAGFATWLDMTPAMPDLFAMPDPDSLIQLPWKKEVAWLSSDLVMEGQLVAQGPRNLLKRLIRQAADLGYEMRAGVECEFFLLTADGKSVADGADNQTKSCYDQQALMRRYEVIAEISDSMIELGWSPYQSDHEDANGQFEMNWEYDEALKTADRHAFFKFMAKSIAEKHGMRATFMPKPFLNLTGSGCHSHVSLWRLGENVFNDTKGELGVSDVGYRFLAGLIEHADAICALTNPTVNSYKRINAPPTFTMRWLLSRLPAFQRKRPEVDLRLTTLLAPVNFDEGRYDIVSMNHVLEHVVEPAVVVERARRLLRPGGVALLELGQGQSLLVEPLFQGLERQRIMPDLAGIPRVLVLKRPK